MPSGVRCFLYTIFYKAIKMGVLKHLAESIRTELPNVVVTDSEFDGMQADFERDNLTVLLEQKELSAIYTAMDLCEDTAASVSNVIGVLQDDMSTTDLKLAQLALNNALLPFNLKLEEETGSLTKQVAIKTLKTIANKAYEMAMEYLKKIAVFLKKHFTVRGRTLTLAKEVQEQAVKLDKAGKATPTGRFMVPASLDLLLSKEDRVKNKLPAVSLVGAAVRNDYGIVSPVNYQGAILALFKEAESIGDKSTEVAKKDIVDAREALLEELVKFSELGKPAYRGNTGSKISEILAGGYRHAVTWTKDTVSSPAHITRRDNAFSKKLVPWEDTPLNAKEVRQLASAAEELLNDDTLNKNESGAKAIDKAAKSLTAKLEAMATNEEASEGDVALAKAMLSAIPGYVRLHQSVYGERVMRSTAAASAMMSLAKSSMATWK